MIYFFYSLMVFSLLSCQSPKEETPTLHDFLQKFTIKAKDLNISYKLPNDITSFTKIELEHYIPSQKEATIYPYAIHHLSEAFHSISFYKKTTEGLEFYFQTFSKEGKILGNSLIVKYTNEIVIRPSSKCCHNIKIRRTNQSTSDGFLLKEINLDEDGKWTIVKDLSDFISNHQAIQKEWANDYSFSNQGSENGKYLLGNDYLLSLKTIPILHIFSKSMASPRAKMLVNVQTNDHKIIIRLHELLYSSKNHVFGNFQKGDILFEIEKQSSEFITTWKKLKPIYGNISDGVCFVLNK